MKTVAAPIYFGLLQSTETTIPTDLKKEKKRKQTFLKGFFSRRTGVGRTWHHDDWLPQFWSFTKYKTILPTPITKKEESEP